MQKLPKLDLNVTNRCNFRCVHCAFDSGCTKLGEFSLGKIKEILSDTKELGGERIDITGGEPLVRKDIFEIVSIAKSLNYKVELVTNGSLLTKEKLSVFKKLGLDSIAVALDGSNYESYSRIRKVGRKTYEQVLKNIKEAVRQGFPVKINTLVVSSTLNDIPKITEFCIKNRIYEHGLYYFTPIGRGMISSELAVEPLQWLDFIRNQLAHFGDKIKLSIEVPVIEKGKLGNKGCIANAERHHLQILPDGKVYPCAILASYNKPIANVFSCSVKDIWNNKKLWEDYWKSISGVFQCSYCVNFKRAFRISSYKEYDFVCPIRKFSPAELMN
jgi:radical SAM protein with 4Fe4S-binding SPASM domain